ncbi:MAG: phospholipase [Verrucomicrobia bacterium]|nr:phospholipase [Verrucomicrobiota bacterium]
MKATLHLLLAPCLLAWITPVRVHAQPSPPPLTEASLTYEIKRTDEIRYLLALPRDYDTAAGKKWPLMLFLHGAGERGNNLQLVTVHGPPKLAKNGTNFPFILVAPQCPAGQRWETEPLRQLLESVTKQHAVDESRVYLTGLSMGGYGTWKLALAHPEKFAAIAPICGGGERIDVLLASRERAAALRRLPVWAFHGAKDPVVPLEESERMVEALKKAGVKDVRLTVYPEAQHDSWTQTYENPELYSWLLKHRLMSPNGG